MEEMGKSGCRPVDLSAAVWDANPGAIAGGGSQATDGHPGGPLRPFNMEKK